MSLKHPSDKPDAARPESVEPVTLSDRVNAVINHGRPFAGRRLPSKRTDG